MLKSTIARLNTQIEELTEEVAALRFDRNKLRTETDLLGEIQALKEKVANLKIEEARILESHAKDKREVEHLVGLQKQRQEFETKKAHDEAVLEVREENLAADKDRFKQEIEFTSKRFNEEVGYLKGIVDQILGRLPDIAVSLKGQVGEKK